MREGRQFHRRAKSGLRGDEKISSRQSVWPHAEASTHHGIHRKRGHSSPMMRLQTMALHCWQVLLLLLVGIQSAQSHSEFAKCRLTTARLAFAGGGFGSSSAKTSKKKPRKRAGFSELKQPPKPVLEKDEPKLDKWGLPIPTEEEIIDSLFPPMPPDTELIPAPRGVTSLAAIKEALKDHITLEYEYFDEEGVERSPSPGNEPLKLKLLHKSPPGMSSS